MSRKIAVVMPSSSASGTAGIAAATPARRKVFLSLQPQVRRRPGGPVVSDVPGSPLTKAPSQRK